MNTAALLPLKPAQVNDFVENGFTVLRGAFSQEVAADARSFLWKARLEPSDMLRNDPSTWPVRHGIAEVFTSADGEAPWVKSVLTPRLLAAYDQLLGQGRYEADELGLGWWVVSFPQAESGPWGASGHFHVDGSDFRHFPDSREHGLRPIFLFSDIGPSEGGTALAVGSHMRVAQLLEEHAEEGLAGGELTAAALALPGVLDDLVEVNGRAGDVVLVHPLLVHARSKNLGTKGADSVRFGCFPCVKMREKLVLHGHPNETTRSYNAVELALVRARERGACPMAFGNGRGRGGRRHGPDAGGLSRKRKRRRRRRSAAKHTAAHTQQQQLA